MMFKDKQFKYEDIFKSDTDESVAVTQTKIKALGDAARKCLASNDFILYRRQFEKSLDSILVSMIQYTNSFFSSEHGDMAKYGANMARFMTKIQDLKVLLDVVEKDSKKGLKNEDKND